LASLVEVLLQLSSTPALLDRSFDDNEAMRAHQLDLGRFIVHGGITIQPTEWLDDWALMVSSFDYSA
jgi:hypothetical protein